LNGYSEGHSYFDRQGKGNIMQFLTSYVDQYNKTKGKGYITIPVGNHDLSRMNINRTDDELEMIFAFAFSMPGVPFFYYGNEIGMRQIYGLPSVEGAYKPRSGARTPMQWSKEKNDGFSTAPEKKLYLGVDTSKDAPNVAEQENNPNSLLNKVRKIIKLKNTEKALASYAEFVPVYAKRNTYPFIYARAAHGEILLCIFNPSDKEVNASFKLNIKAGKLTLISGKESKITNENLNYDAVVPGIAYSIYKLE
jgi:maltose alpha-D-glucosyltransferase/alpha-amylase